MTHTTTSNDTDTNVGATTKSEDDDDNGGCCGCSVRPTSYDDSGGGANAGRAIVVVAKCPIPNKSKTRLLPLLGVRGATQLAKAMLCDVLLTLSKCVSLFHLREDDCLRSS